MHMLKIFSVLFSILLFTSSSFAEPVLVKEFIGQLEFVKGRIMQLAEAMPEDKYTWRPDDEVRSVGEVYVHIADANIYFLSLMTGNETEYEAENNNDKKTALKKLEQSFQTLKESVSKFTEEDLNREIEAFGRKFTVRNFMITLISHIHEHLGQSIAYARMNNVTPPWSLQD